MRHKLTTIVNIVGLSLGICVCLIIYLILSFELNFESFVPDRGNTYRLVNNRKLPDGSRIDITNLPFPVKNALRQELTATKLITGFHLYDYYGRQVNIPIAGNRLKKYFSRGEIAIAAGDYFSMFPAKVLAGNISLHEPYQVVLTRDKAEKYFGHQKPANFLGKQVIYGDSLRVTVGGIIDNWPKNTDFGFKDFISESTSNSKFLIDKFNNDDWNSESETIFVQLNDKRAYKGMLNQLEAFSKKYLSNQPDFKNRIFLQPLSAVHFSTEFNYEYEYPLNKTYLPALYGLAGIALFILILAAINFINLSAARAITRSKEIGIRKVIGSSRFEIISQLLVETLIITVISVLISVTLIVPVLSYFKSYIPEGVIFSLVNPVLYLFLAGITIFTTFLAGFYPAFRLSGLAPVSSLKGNYFFQSGSLSNYLRKGLIVFQFTISLCFVLCAVIMGSQLRYIFKKGPGFKTDAIISFYAGTPDDNTNKIKSFSDRVRQIPGVSNVALQSFDPISSVHIDIKLIYKNKDEKELTTAIQYGDRNFISLYQMPIIAGRNPIPSDSSKELIINRSVVSLLGFTNPKDAIDKTLYYGETAFTVAAVIEDFHENSFYEAIRPVVIKSDATQEQAIAVKLDVKGKQSGVIKAVLGKLEALWKEYYPDRDFYYRFMDDSISAMYEKDQRTSDLINISVLITLCISCMGLFGLSVFTAQRKTKEIGIRKVLGASTLHIFSILIRDLIYLILLAAVIASPIGWYFMNTWMENFTYRVPVSWWMFVLSGMGAIVLALVTVSFQGIRAANANPVESIRS